ncbi:hypothetical protein DQ354_15940 [Arthrobacter sp. AQ5-06]|nr:hypothetical protein DQ354_15940 [Arthrobacter sp. AQ5-06]
MAIYGGGYGFTSLRDAGWLRDCEVLYWGDLDTHGFRILDQLRAVHPHVVSVLMDESALYEGLSSDSFGTAVRLEQELIRWDWALAQLRQFSGSGT